MKLETLASLTRSMYRPRYRSDAMRWLATATITRRCIATRLTTAHSPGAAVAQLTGHSDAAGGTSQCNFLGGSTVADVGILARHRVASAARLADPQRSGAPMIGSILVRSRAYLGKGEGEQVDVGDLDLDHENKHDG